MRKQRFHYYLWNTELYLSLVSVISIERDYAYIDSVWIYIVSAALMADVIARTFRYKDKGIIKPRQIRSNIDNIEAIAIMWFALLVYLDYKVHMMVTVAIAAASIDLTRRIIQFFRLNRKQRDNGIGQE